MLLSLKRFLRVCAGLAGWLLFNFALIYLAYLVDTRTTPVADAADMVLTAVFFSLNLIIPTFLIYLRHKRRPSWINDEADRWLARRRSANEPRRQIYQKLLQQMLWIPSLLAMSVLLFLPESMGLVSHAFAGRAFNLNGHYLRLPLTSFITYHRDDRYVAILIGKGIGRVGVGPYLRGHPALSSLFFDAVQDPAHFNYQELYLRRERLTSQRTLPFGNESLTCWDLALRTYDPGPDFVRIKCLASTNDFTAGFDGLREDESTFYDVLERAETQK
jgi:hypothetical protein